MQVVDGDEERLGRSDIAQPPGTGVEEREALAGAGWRRPVSLTELRHERGERGSISQREGGPGRTGTIAQQRTDDLDERPIGRRARIVPAARVDRHEPA